jgi:dihydrolipoamide dehydrogenase
MRDKPDLIILGGGPGGYVAALRAAQLKKRVVLIESDELGGTCMNYGCIPTKYLLHQTQVYKELRESKNIVGELDKIRLNWKKVQDEKKRVVERLVKGVEFLLKKNGVKVIKGTAFLKNENQVVVEENGEAWILESNYIILAMGSRPAEFPFLAPNGKEVITSREALEMQSIPEKMLVIGAGAIGLEIGTIYQRIGTKVIVLEIMPTILPGSDKDMVTRLERILKRQGLEIHTQMKIEESLIKGGKVFLKGINLHDQSPFELEADKVLLATGRRANSESLRDQITDTFLDEQGFVKVSAQFETSVSGIYAVGDLIGGRLLAHKASQEGIVVAENISGSKKTINYGALPYAVYTEPEFSSVGLTEEEAQEIGIKTQVGVFSLQANGRALAMGKSEGMVKIIADEKDKIIGAHLLAPQASELIAEMTLAIIKGMKLQEVSSSIHVHPTLSEAVMEAALSAKKEALHVLND